MATPTLQPSADYAVGPIVDARLVQGDGTTSLVKVVLPGFTILAADGSAPPSDASGIVTQPYAVSASRWQYAGATGGITDTADVIIKASAGVGVCNYLTGIQYANTGVASEIVVKDGATVIWRGFAATTTGIENSITFAVPLKGSAATALNVAMITTASATRVSAQGYVGA